jgi:CheY-like chemotaxis protein
LADHWANRKLLQAMVGQRGLASDWAENGQEAVERAARTRFDIILMVRQHPC